MSTTHRPHRGILKNGAVLWAALAVIVTTVAWAQGHGPRAHREHSRGMLPVLMHHLDLTEEQRSQVHDAFRKHQELMGAKAEAFHQAKDTLAQQIHADVFDEGAIRNAAATAADLEVDLAVSKAELFQEIKQILTQEQMDQLHAIMSEHAAEHPGAGLHMRHPAPEGQ